MNNKLNSSVYFEINVHLTLNKCFLRAYYVISTVLGTRDAIINKTKGISSFCGVYVLAVKIVWDLYLKKLKAGLLGGESKQDIIITMKKTNKG